MKKIFQLLLVLCSFCIALPVAAQYGNYTDAKYLKGAVPEVNNFVVFTETVSTPGKSKADIYAALETYAKSLLKSEIAGPQCRLTELTPETATIAASMEETLTFKRTNWILDQARCFYQLIFEAKDGEFTTTIRRIRYLYEPMEVSGIESTLSAEDWITDAQALNKKGQLNKVGGKKFRFATINRKDEVIAGAKQAVMGK